MLVQQLCDTFNHEFADFQTRLVGGFDEPFYQAGPPAQIQFRADYPRSALHEVAHWCVAGTERRKLDDYGYWYAPDGRNAAQQKAFEQVEVRPQALESLFCAALGIDFSPSLDNLNGDAGDGRGFEQAIEQLLAEWQNHPQNIPPRGQRFINKLSQLKCD